MEPTNEEQTQHTARLDKVFFSQTSALKVQHDNNRPGIFLGIGKKADDGTWTWKTTKLKDTEAAQIIRLIQGRAQTVDFYHTFQGEATKIQINKKDDDVYIKIEDHSKKIDPAEQEVLRIILEDTILQAATERPPRIP